MKSNDPLRILLVDDSRGDALLIEKYMRQVMQDGLVLLHAATLSHALRALSQDKFDIVLLDRSLPDVVDNSGLQSIQNMVPSLPVIYLTAYKSENTAVQAIEDGAQDYILKDKMDGHAIKRAIRYAIIRKQFENSLLVQAHQDRLTGLANFLSFEKRLASSMARLKRYGGAVGIFYMDLNRFKPINDTHGHAVGDRMLAEIGARLKLCLRSADMPARVGGDEFAILIEDGVSSDHCAFLAQKLITAIETPFMTSGIELKVGVSIGIALCPAGSPITGAELLSGADKAMYEAKKSGNSMHHFWMPEQSRQSSVA